MKKHLLISLWMLASLGCMGRATHPSSGLLPEGARLVDLTYDFDEKTLYWPTSPSGFELKQLSHGMTAGGYFYASNTLCAPEHGGTHLDAPIHFAEGKMTAEQLPLERLIAPAVVIDISADAAKDPDALLQPSHVEAFEKEHGRIGPGTIVLVRTGWGRFWPDRKQYLGDDTPGDASKLHFPGISREAAEALVARQAAAVGIDTASVDHGPSKDFIAHRVLMKANTPAFENVAAMEKLPIRGALIVALPMKVRGGSGGPLRIVAVLPPA
ncbi:cyclase family protein [Archangium violaceum]|uniref:cyclase family protein n=1 Tax=Archangium violaceum TaxID=83451 RepID=UPI0036DCFFD5